MSVRDVPARSSVSESPRKSTRVARTARPRARARRRGVPTFQKPLTDLAHSPERTQGKAEEVTWEDQQHICAFGRFNQRMHEVNAELKAKAVRAMPFPVPRRLPTNRRRS